MTTPQELRAKCDWCMPCKRCIERQKQAADEIEQLRSELAELRRHTAQHVTPEFYHPPQPGDTLP